MARGDGGGAGWEDSSVALVMEHSGCVVASASMEGGLTALALGFSARECVEGLELCEGARPLAPTAAPTPQTASPTSQSPTGTTVVSATESPTAVPTAAPSTAPTRGVAMGSPTGGPTASPTAARSTAPTSDYASGSPTGVPTSFPTAASPTGAPTSSSVRVVSSVMFGDLDIVSFVDPQFEAAFRAAFVADMSTAAGVAAAAVVVEGISKGSVLVDSVVGFGSDAAAASAFAALLESSPALHQASRCPTLPRASW